LPILARISVFQVSVSYCENQIQFNLKNPIGKSQQRLSAARFGELPVQRAADQTYLLRIVIEKLSIEIILN